jgi:hypothetical protein
VKISAAITLATVAGCIRGRTSFGKYAALCRPREIHTPLRGVLGAGRGMTALTCGFNRPHHSSSRGTGTSGGH